MISVFLGTRPEIVKLSPIIRLLIKKQKKFVIVHTNQHFSANMDSSFFEALELPPPNFNLKVAKRNNGEMLSEIISKAGEVLSKVKPSLVLVQGDTNSVLGGTLSALKLGIPVGHVEAGLRSYDDSMPEELNRRLCDHVSDFLFCPTDVQEKILLGEGISKSRIFVTGNTIVDAVLSSASTSIGSDPSVAEYLLLTLHRPSNVDNRDVLSGILKGIEAVSKKFKTKVIFPVHPRTKKMLSKFNLTPDKNIFELLDPVGYLKMINYEKNAKLILTDSGGIQEEACILNVPCVTIRENTERPETIKVGSNALSGVQPEAILDKSVKMIKKRGGWANPYGDGKSAQKILKILEKNKLL